MNVDQAPAAQQRQRFDLYAIWGTPDGELFAAGKSRVVLRKAAAGSRFVAETASLRAHAQYRALWGEAGELYAAGDFGLFNALAPPKDGVRGWVTRADDTTFDFRALAGRQKDLYAATARGTILHSTDAGATWARSEPLVVTSNARALYCESDKSIFVAGTEGMVLHSSDGGATWAAQKTGTEQELRGVGGTGKDVWVVGAAGEIRRSSNGGASWSAVSSGVTGDLNAVWGSPSGDVVVVGDEGVILFAPKGSTSFTTMVSGSQSALRAIWGRSANDIFVVGDEGTLLHSFNGKQWTVGKSGTSKDLQAIAGGPTGPIYAVGLGVFLRLASGAAWETVTETRLALAGVSVGPLGEVDAVGGNEALYSTDAGATLRAERVTQDELHALARTPGGRLFALGETAVLYLDPRPH